MKNKEVWDYVAPKPGDQIRVKLANYYHHGIYISHDEVIQFGYGDERDIGHSERVEVNKVSLAEFLHHGFLEVRIYSKKEREKRNHVQRTIEIARAYLGNKGYHILDNNCEHFSNFCVFNEKYSDQAELFTKDVLEKVKK